MQYKFICAYHMPKPYRQNSYTTDVFSAFICCDRVIFWKVFNGIILFVAKYLLTCYCSIKHEGLMLWHILDSKYKRNLSLFVRAVYLLFRCASFSWAHCNQTV